MDHPNHDKSNRSLALNVITPFLIWAGVILLFVNVKHLPFELDENGQLALRHATKIMGTIFLPLALIFLLHKNKADFGIYFPKTKGALRLAWQAYAIGGPACMTFLYIGLMGWGLHDWPSAMSLAAVFSLVAYVIPRITKNLANDLPSQKSLKPIFLFVILSLVTLVVAYFTNGLVPYLWRVLYYLFIVALGEEMFFRGYMQSAMNRYFGKPFSMGGVSFGWGLVLAALAFGLIHALVATPPTWPHALWTFIFGLSLGYLREKEGSILVAVFFHALMDMPLAFIG